MQVRSFHPDITNRAIFLAATAGPFVWQFLGSVGAGEGYFNLLADLAIAALVCALLHLHPRVRQAREAVLAPSPVCYGHGPIDDLVAHIRGAIDWAYAGIRAPMAQPA